MNQLTFWTEVANKLKKQTGTLIVMVAMDGSGPNRPGSKMCVFEDGSCVGTVGGGAAEYILVERAKKFVGTKPELITLDHHGTDAPHGSFVETSGRTSLQSGMICDGEQTYVVMQAKPKFAAGVLHALQYGKRVQLVLTEAGLDLMDVVDFVDDVNIFEKKKENRWCYKEIIGTIPHAFIIGGGHCCLALTPLLVSLGFRVTVLDNRKELAAINNNQAAHEIKTVDYNNISEFVPEDDKHYVIIMTFGHKHDELVLEKLINRRYRYLGMMGSKSKVATIFKNLQSRGVSDQFIKKIHSPIGLPINSNTPEEIAVSIAAEMVKVRNM